MEPIIKIKGIGKKYNITHQKGRYVALRDVLANVFRNPFKFVKHKAKQIAGFETKEEFWALRNINLEIHKGDIVGIIGHNGAGKSTLLKILTGITPPTEGEIIMRGRVASLLEVGTGFHPELTGRENIFLNGAILGMNGKEIARKFDEIVTFAGIERFLDTPVKHYSSGMYVRLAFSVAAHMEPDILLVDEVLAVGDAEFQKKCLGKMEEVTQKEGRTILFVSHNLSAIKQLCSKSVLLKEGKVILFDETDKVIEKYLQKENQSSGVPLYERRDRTGLGGVTFTDIQITNQNNEKEIHSGDRLKILLKYESEFTNKIKDVRVVIVIVNDNINPVLWLDSDITKHSFGDLEPRGGLLCETGEIHLSEGRYFVHINFHIEGESRDRILMAGEFVVKTNIENYDFRTETNMDICDYLVKYNFKQNG